MSRRVKRPGADEFFGGLLAAPGDPDATHEGQAWAASPGPSGRVRHEEKITVYVSSDELKVLERTRLRLRAELGMNVDRGRLVREAIGIMLADLDANGADSVIVRRLRR
ncbi:MAG: hypothetical protein GX454_09505 [Brooklawnia sp.]|nr:hypothetical protein [Brooklawnia sp.]